MVWLWEMLNIPKSSILNGAQQLPWRCNFSDAGDETCYHSKEGCLLMACDLMTVAFFRCWERKAKEQLLGWIVSIWAAELRSDISVDRNRTALQQRQISPLTVITYGLPPALGTSTEKEKEVPDEPNDLTAALLRKDNSHAGCERKSEVPPKYI